MDIAVSELPAHPVPKVSVCVTTFNHEAFIAQALDGILMQETEFPFEVIVGDDCSTDRTREIVREYQRRYPDRVRTVLPDRNMGDSGKKLFAEILRHGRGTYIAYMDGDDYWTAPHKLQAQVAFLEANPDHSLCFHEVALLGDASGTTLGLHTGTDLDDLDIWRWCYIASCSPVFRRDSIIPLPPWYHEVVYGDWPLYMTASTRGRIGYTEEVMGVYRVHREGMWNRQSEEEKIKGVIAFYEVIKARFGVDVSDRLDEYIFLNRHWLFRVYESSQNFPEARRCAVQCLATLRHSRLVPFREVLGMLIKAAAWTLTGQAPLRIREAKTSFPDPRDKVGGA